MARTRKAESAQEPENPTQAPTETPAANSAGSDEPSQEHKSGWLSRFPTWVDKEAGVHLIEDRQNRRMTIKFDEKPSAAVRKVIKEEYSYRFDGDNQLWYKRMNQATPRQDREEAEQLACTAANMIRQEKGLEPKQSFSIGM